MKQQNRRQRIQEKIQGSINIQEVIVEDESFRHHVPEGAETHFKVTVISDHFSGKSRIARHRFINELLAEEFDSGLHALSIHAFSPTEWGSKEQKTPASPNCRDGFSK